MPSSKGTDDLPRDGRPERLAVRRAEPLPDFVDRNLRDVDRNVRDAVAVHHVADRSPIADAVGNSYSQLPGELDVDLVDPGTDEDVAYLALATPHVLDLDDVVPERRAHRTDRLTRTRPPRGVREFLH